LVGEIARIGIWSLSPFDADTHVGVQIPNKLDDGFSCCISTSNRSAEFFSLNGHEFERHLVTHFEIIQHFDRWLANDGDSEPPLRDLEGKDSVGLEVDGLERISEWQPGLHNRRHDDSAKRTSPYEARGVPCCRAGLLDVGVAGHGVSVL
jgi:hypothetical protein